MNRLSGPTSCLKYHYNLSEATVVVDWREIKRQMPNQADEAKSAPNKAAPKQPKGPLGPGQGAATFASTIQDIEARYGGGRVVQERGYERDGFVVSDEEDSGFYEDEDAISPDDFFVTQGPTDRRKRTHDDVLPGLPEEADPVAKKQKLQEGMVGLPVPVREAILKFQEEWVAFTKGKPDLMRFPPEMEPALLLVGQTSMAHHPKGFLSSETVDTLESITSFSTATLKVRIKRAVEAAASGGGAAGANGRPAGLGFGASTSSHAPHPDAIAYLISIGEGYNTIFENKDDQARNAELQKRMEVHLADLNDTIKGFAATFAEPPKRSPWNDTIRTKIKTLFALNDSIVPPPIAPGTLRTHLLSLWPSDWDVKDSQIKPLTRYQPRPPKPTETTPAQKQ